MDALGALVIAPESVDVQNILKVCPALGFPVLPGLFRVQLAIVAGAGNTGDIAQLSYRKNVVLLGQCGPDDAKFEAGKFHRHPSESGCHISF